MTCGASPRPDGRTDVRALGDAAQAILARFVRGKVKWRLWGDGGRRRRAHEKPREGCPGLGWSGVGLSQPTISRKAATTA
jgi:hypothetical protein